MEATLKIINSVVKKSPHAELLEEAFQFAKTAYADKKTPWGELYLAHIAGTAATLERWGLDHETIIAGILHDALEISERDKSEHLKEIHKRFGATVASLIATFSELKRIYFLFQFEKGGSFFAKEKIENVRRMFLAIAKDVRVVLIELASRKDRLYKIENLPIEQKRLYANETLQVFVPIANRLGLGLVRRELEDLAFVYLFPEEFRDLKEKMKIPYEDREKHLKKFLPYLKKVLKKERAKVLNINYRAKSYWSTFLKLPKVGNDVEKIHDLLAIRIITDNVESCYKILGIIHKYFHPISEEIDDYIAKPKANGYRSLHTTVFYEKDQISEIQIRTEEMHEEAEYGVCAHWSYKEQIDLRKNPEEFSWSKEMPYILKHFKLTFYENQVFVFTPKGDVLMLPKDSSPVDFAYAVHSEVGNHADGVKINGKMETLSTKLHNGDIIEITTNKNKLPSKDWLRFVKTSFARSNIKKATDPSPSTFKFPIPGFIKKGFEGLTRAIKKTQRDKKRVAKEKPKQITLAGQKGILMRLAKCCNPQPGDKVKAYLAPYRGAILHRTTCSHLMKIKEKFPEKIVDASWQ